MHTLDQVILLWAIAETLLQIVGDAATFQLLLLGLEGTSSIKICSFVHEI